jgi:hypothetical protein
LRDNSMKPKRVILVFDCDEAAGSCTRLILQTRGYLVISCKADSERVAIMRSKPIELLLLGTSVVTDKPSPISDFECRFVGGVPMLQMSQGESVLNLIERIRIALIRKRGPKSSQMEAARCTA